MNTLILTPIEHTRLYNRLRRHGLEADGGEVRWPGRQSDPLVFTDIRFHRPGPVEVSVAIQARMDHDSGRRLFRGQMLDARLPLGAGRRRVTRYYPDVESVAGCIEGWLEGGDAQ